MVTGGGVPWVVNSSTETSLPVIPRGSWLEAAQRPVYLVAEVNPFNSILMDFPFFTNGKKNFSNAVLLESFPPLKSANVGLVTDPKT